MRTTAGRGSAGGRKVIKGALGASTTSGDKRTVVERGVGKHVQTWLSDGARTLAVREDVNAWP